MIQGTTATIIKGGSTKQLNGSHLEKADYRTAYTYFLNFYNLNFYKNFLLRHDGSYKGLRFWTFLDIVKRIEENASSFWCCKNFEKKDTGGYNS